MKAIICVAISAIIISCNLGEVTVDPIGHSFFHIINGSGETIGVEILETGQYTRRYVDSCVLIEPNDTMLLGHYTAFTPPWPYECFDSLKYNCLNGNVDATINIADSALWDTVFYADTYPDTSYWYYIILDSDGI